MNHLFKKYILLTISLVYLHVPSDLLARGGSRGSHSGGHNGGRHNNGGNRHNGGRGHNGNHGNYGHHGYGGGYWGAAGWVAFDAALLTTVAIGSSNNGSTSQKQSIHDLEDQVDRLNQQNRQMFTATEELHEKVEALEQENAQLKLSK